MKKPMAVLFDWDGTLADTSKAVSSSLTQVFAEYGKESYDNMIAKYRDVSISVKANFKNYFGAEEKQAYQRYLQIYRQGGIQKVTPTAGATEFLKLLQSKGVRIYIASNKEPSLLDAEIKQCFADITFDGVCANGQAAFNKPHPAPILELLKDVPFAINAQNVWLVGDSLPDYVSAIAAGVRPVILNGAEVQKMQQSVQQSVVPSFYSLIDDVKKQEEPHSSPVVEFTKMHGLGNDYVYINCTENALLEQKASGLAKLLSKPHIGVGADGVILICKATDKAADFKMRMFNADGSEGQMCGNGIRCVGKYVYDKKLTSKKDLTIETLAGLKYLHLSTDSDNQVETVEVDMGKAVVGAEHQLQVLDKTLTGTVVSVGNPHFIIWVDDVANFDVQKYGPLIENNLTLFPERTNVEFVQKRAGLPVIKMRVWERGSGETMACGTGACATFAAAKAAGKIDNSAQIQLLGGVLSITQNDKGHILMTGPTTSVFDGKISLKQIAHVHQSLLSVEAMRQNTHE